MDINDPVTQLCIEGTRAEFAGKPEAAAELYRQAWQVAVDDFGRCVAAHYVARTLTEAQEIYDWNLAALTYADRVGDDRVRSFYPSLYLNMGKSCELLGRIREAQEYYARAAELGFAHQEKG